MVRGDVDVVDLCLPQHLMAEVAIAAVENGKHVLCEKPMAMSLAEGRAMADAAEKAGVVNQVNYNYRRVPAVALAKQIIDEGRIGEVRHWRATYHQQSLVDPHAPLRWKHQKKFAGSGAHGDLNSHCIDLAHYLVGRIDEVTACQMETFVKERPLGPGSSEMGVVDVDDISQLQVRFGNGAVGTFEASRVATGHFNKNQFEVFGEKGALRWNLEDLSRLEFFSMEDPPHLRGYREILVTDPAHPYMAKWWPKGHLIGYEHSFVHAVADFLAAVDGKTVASPSFKEGAEVLRVLDEGLKLAYR